MTTSKLRQDYDDALPWLKRARTKAVKLLHVAFAAKPIRVHSVVARIKTFESVERKLREKQTQSMRELSDLLGVRVVCLFLGDIDDVAAVACEVFDVVNDDNRVEPEDLARFAYMSRHLDLRFRAKDRVGKPLRAIGFELQIRTIAMDAWANASHHLSYRTDVDIPTELKRDFYALNGLFYVADKHFELFYRASLRSKRDTLAVFRRLGISGVGAEPLNADTLAAYLNLKFPVRKHSGASAVADLLSELYYYGARTIRDVDTVVDAGLQKKCDFDRDSTELFLSDVGVVRAAFEMHEGIV